VSTKLSITSSGLVHFPRKNHTIAEDIAMTPTSSTHPSPAFNPSHNATRTKSRITTLLSEALERNVSSYAIAAASASVALLAAASPAKAEVVFTKTDIAVPVNGGPVWFDINGDGQNDFALSIVHFGVSTCTFTQDVRTHKKRLPLGCGAETTILKIKPGQAGDEVWQAGTSNTGFYPHKCAADLFAGRQITPLRRFGTATLTLGGNSGSSIGFHFCPWNNEQHKPYLGVKFLDSAGKLHYGWIRVEEPFLRQTTIEGFAYETTPNTPIVAGQTSGSSSARVVAPSADFSNNTAEPVSLGRLAQGASGLGAWRRDDPAAAN
jgi:hypothetical protein